MFEYVRNDDGKVHDTMELKKQWNYYDKKIMYNVYTCYLYKEHRSLPKFNCHEDSSMHVYQLLYKNVDIEYTGV